MLSFGTEGRVEGSVIPPSQVLHDFVCFRGQDIMDLHVHDAEADEVRCVRLCTVNLRGSLVSRDRGRWGNIYMYSYRIGAALHRTSRQAKKSNPLDVDPSCFPLFALGLVVSLKPHVSSEGRR